MEFARDLQKGRRLALREDRQVRVLVLGVKTALARQVSEFKCFPGLNGLSGPFPRGSARQFEGEFGYILFWISMVWVVFQLV